MTGFGDQTENAVLDMVLRGVVWGNGIGVMLSLHTADPGENGANEITGGSYARQVGSWLPASGGACGLQANVDFPGMPAGSVTFCGVWTTTGVFVGGGPTTARTLAAGDVYRLDTGTTFSLN